jgi:O-antigen ligase
MILRSPSNKKMNSLRNNPYHPSDQWLFFCYLLVIIWMPLPQGSVASWANGVLQISIFTLFIALLGLYASGRLKPTSPLKHSRTLLLLLLFFLSWIVLQLVPLPTSLVSLFSPKAFEYHNTGLLEHSSPWIHLSLYPFATATQALNSITYILFLVLTLQLINSSQRIRLLIWVVVGCGIFQAVYGGLAALTHSTVATGSFVNRNHLGGYLEMCLALGIGLLISETRDIQMVSWRHRLFTILNWLGSSKFRLRLGLALMVVTLVLTHSRGSNTAFLFSIIVTGVAWLLITRKRPSLPALVMLISILVIDVLIIGEWFGFDKVVQRLQETSVATEQRDDVWRETILIIKDFPLTGSGAGSFVSIFPSYRDAASSGGNVFFGHAHNDYLEFLMETGPVGFILLAGVPLLALVQAWRAMSKRQRSLLRGVGFGSFMGIIAILYHSLADFNLRIPSNAMMFMLLIGLAYIGAYHGASGNSSRRQDNADPASGGDRN